MKKKLIFDVSTERGIVGIYINETLVFHEELPFGNLSSKFLLPTIEKGFHTLGIQPAELSYVAVGVGPGSYTGIRLGAIVAKTLAFACEIPLIGICTLDSFVPLSDGHFAVLIDAKISGVYFQKGLKVGSIITRLSEPEAVPLKDLGDKLKDVHYLVTPHAQPLKAKLEVLYPNLNGEWIERAPSLDRLDQLAKDKFDKKEFDPNGELELIYLRKTQAEIEREK